MAEPMQSGGAFIGWHLSIADCAGTGLSSGTGYYNTSNVFVSSALPSGWTPMVGTGSGGSGDLLLPVELHLQSGTVLNDTRYPDHGQPGLATADRVFHLSIPAPFTTATWRRLDVGVYNVQANTTAALTVSLLNVSASTTVATHTFASASSPGGTNHELNSTDTIASGTYSDRQKFQWHIVSAQAINSFGLWAYCWYQLS